MAKDSDKNIEQSGANLGGENGSNFGNSSENLGANLSGNLDKNLGENSNFNANSNVNFNSNSSGNFGANQHPNFAQNSAPNSSQNPNSQSTEQPARPRSHYILPNLFTAASCFCGVIATIWALNGNYEKAVVYVFFSLIFDGLDGRVARLTRTTSRFGLEFDSLADIVAFGVAPAILCYCSIGFEYGKLGALVSAIFVVFGAIRLARFNITTGTYEPNVFIGLPIPTAAITLCAWVYFARANEIVSGAWLVLVLALFLAFLMISNVRFPSFKKINFKERQFNKIFVILVLLCALFYLHAIVFLLVVTTAYIGYGVIRAVYLFVNFKIFHRY